VLSVKFDPGAVNHNSLAVVVRDKKDLSQVWQRVNNFDSQTGFGWQDSSGQTGW